MTDAQRDVAGGEGGSDRRPPAPAMLLGYAGLLPPAAAIVGALFGDPFLAPILLLAAIGYAAVILSFLGGMWWSAAAIQVRGAALWPWLTVAVMPSLAAFAGGLLVLSGTKAGAALIAIGLLAALGVDLLLVRAGHVPRWWMRLRVPLSVGLAVLTLFASLLLPG